MIHPLRWLDRWWMKTSPKRRLDRDAIGVTALMGFAAPTLSISLVGPTPTSVLRDMSDDLQISMCVCIVLGLLVMLHGVLLGSPFYFPKAPVKRSYTRGFTGAPAAVLGLGVYSYYIIENTQTWASALSAMLTPLLALGITIQAFIYWLEVRRIEVVETRLIKQTKVAIANEHSDDT